MGYIEFDQYNALAYIYPSDVPYDYKTMILDSNLAIKIERAYYTPQSIPDFEKRILSDYFHRNRSNNKDPYFIFSYFETCWDFSENNINEEKYQKLKKATMNTIKWNKTDLQNHFRNGIDRNYIIADKVDKKTVTSLARSFFDIPLLLSYISVLKILIIQKKYNLKQRNAAVQEYSSFINNDLRVNGAIELHLVINYFFGSSEANELANGLFKFDKKTNNILYKALNTAWDFYYLRRLNYYYDNMGKDDVYFPVLITADKSLIELARLIEDVPTMHSEALPPIIGIHELDIKSDFKNMAHSIIDSNFASAYDRKIKMTKIDSDNHFIQLAESLEKELLMYSDAKDR